MITLYYKLSLGLCSMDTFLGTFLGYGPTNLTICKGYTKSKGFLMDWDAFTICEDTGYRCLYSLLGDIMEGILNSSLYFSNQDFLNSLSNRRFNFYYFVDTNYFYIGNGLCDANDFSNGLALTICDYSLYIKELMDWDDLHFYSGKRYLIAMFLKGRVFNILCEGNSKLYFRLSGFYLNVNGDLNYYYCLYVERVFAVRSYLYNYSDYFMYLMKYYNMIYYFWLFNCYSNELRDYLEFLEDQDLRDYRYIIGLLYFLDGCVALSVLVYASISLVMSYFYNYMTYLNMLKDVRDFGYSRNFTRIISNCYGYIVADLISCVLKYANKAFRRDFPVC